MKRTALFIFAAALSLSSYKAFCQGMAINSDGADANSSAMLDVSSTTQGMLVPRMTQFQRFSITSPVTGLLVYQTDGTKGFYVYDGTAWIAVTATAGWALTGNAGINAATNFIGTIDNKPLRFRVNNTWAGHMNFDGDIFIGLHAGLNGTSSSRNIAIGRGTLKTMMFTQGNVAIGDSVMTDDGIPTDNVGIGYTALRSASGTTGNVAIGRAAMYKCTTGQYNTAVGFNSLNSITDGFYNSGFGGFALKTNVTGDMNTGLGYNTDVASANLTNSTAVGYAATVNASNKVVIGGSAVTVVGGPVAWSNLSDRRFKSQIQENVPGLDFILKLRPVTYHFDARKFERFLGRPDSMLQQQAEALDMAESKVRTGFIAQEVELAAQQTRYDFSGLNKPTNDKDNYSLAYAEFTVPMVKAIQEQQKTIEELKEQLEVLAQKVRELSKK